MVIKNSLARRATEGTTLAPAFEGLDGTAAVVWGGEDFVSLVKEVVELDKSVEYEAFQARGGVMDGEALDADKVREISKWPSRLEQLSLLSGQLTAPWMSPAIAADRTRWTTCQPDRKEIQGRRQADPAIRNPSSNQPGLVPKIRRFAINVKRNRVSNSENRETQRVSIPATTPNEPARRGDRLNS